MQNQFIKSLLSLQQDGQRSISGPVNWLDEPLIAVRTNLSETIEALEKQICPSRNSDGKARWHFFIGSPGNGKSAGAGQLARKLDQHGDLIVDSASKKSLKELSTTDLPYRLDVYEDGKSYPYLLIAQDASVLPDPFDDAADPARALEELLLEASFRGTSLVVCTNRGVIERAFSTNYLNPKKNQTPWFSAIRMAVGDVSPGAVRFNDQNKKHVSESAIVSLSTLDQRSLLLGDSTFESLIEALVAPQNWAVCEGCPSQSLCPFKGNRDWLANKDLRRNFTDLLLHAELFDGQIIVLREALALLSLILSGCPHDYGSASPCDWVHDRERNGDYFSLLSRRIYMTLFTSYAAHGLSNNKEERKRETLTLKRILNCEYELDSACAKAVNHIVKKNPSLSTDVGVQRLLGECGVLNALDPLADLLPLDFLDRWGESCTALRSLSNATALEIRCADFWENLLSAVELSPSSTHEDYALLARWITAVTIRLGAMVEGRTKFKDDLQAFAQILEIGDQGLTLQKVELLNAMDSTLARSLEGTVQGLSLTESASLHGNWVKQGLKPKFVPGASGDSPIKVHMKFGESNESGNKGTKVTVDTKAFVWLKRMSERHITTSTFPSQYLETALDARQRVAVASNYDLAQEIELTVSRPNSESPISVIRSHGVINVKK